MHRLSRCLLASLDSSTLRACPFSVTAGVSARADFGTTWTGPSSSSSNIEQQQDVAATRRSRVLSQKPPSWEPCRWGFSRQPALQGMPAFQRHFSSPNDTRVEYVDALVTAIVADKEAPNHEALGNLFRDFNGEKMLQTTGVLALLEPHARKVLAELSTAFLEDAAAHKFSVQQCSNILSTFVLLGHFDTRLKDAIVDHVMSGIASADSEALGSICYALGVGGYSDFNFFIAVEKEIQARAETMPPRDLAKCIWMFSRLSRANEKIDSALDKLVDRITSDDNTTMTDLAYALWACGDDEVAASKVTNRIMAAPVEQIGSLTPSAIAKLAYGLAKEQVDDKYIWDAVAGRVRAIADELFPRDIAKLLWAFGCVNHVSRSMLAALEPCMLRHLSKFTHNELSMMITAYNNFGIHNAMACTLANRMGADTHMDAHTEAKSLTKDVPQAKNK